MIAKEPININGQIYDRYNINLAISSRYKADGNLEVNAAMSLIPAKINEGSVQTDDQNHKAFLLGSIDDAGGAEKQAFLTIKSAIENYLRSKGL